MEATKILIRGVAFDNVSMEEAVARSLSYLRESGAHVIHTPNAEIVQLCCEDDGICKLVNSAELVVPDGAGVILAAKILGKPLRKGKVAGVVLGERILSECAAPENAFPVFFLGGKLGVAMLAAEKLREKYPGLNVCGCHDGYFSDDRAVIDEINRSGAKFLMVCLGVPKQEQWMATHRKEFTSVSLMAGLGGSLDVYAGINRRAPDIFIRCGCEWLYRLLKEPKRIGRMMKLPKFLLGTIGAKLCGKG